MSDSRTANYHSMIETGITVVSTRHGIETGSNGGLEM